MKKQIIVVAVLASSVVAFARPHGGGGWGPGFGGGPRPPSHHGGWWGHGGCNFWPGFIGGVVGGLACNAVAAPCYRETVVVQPAPAVVTQPVVVRQPVITAPVTQTQSVWVEGRYVDTVQADGTVVRTWNPGHYETRTIVVQ